MYKIGIISDTHGLIRPEIMNVLTACDCIVHAGDIDQPEVFDTLRTLAPVYAVRGNADKGIWAGSLPKSLSITLAGVRFFVVHNKKQITDDLSDIDVIVYGHTHKYHEEYKNSQLWLNPGCCGYRKASQPVMLAVLEVVDNGSYTVRRVEIPHESLITQKGNKQPALPKNIDKVLKKAVKEIISGHSVEEIAKRTGISTELADLICRMYLTHPGIDLDGMIRRLEERIPPE